MGFARMTSAGLDGIDAFVVDVEVDLGGGVARVIVVGLPDPAVREARDRVQSAVKNAGFKFPCGRVTINLAPARRRKEGAFDLAIALDIIAAQGTFSPDRLRGLGAIGELSLTGRTQSVRGALASAEALHRSGIRRVLVSRASAAEAALAADDLEVVPVDDLAQAVAIVKGTLKPERIRVDRASLALADPREEGLDLADVRGSESSKRALIVAAAGGHDLLFVGPPGAGKTMLARRLPGILPPLVIDEALEITRVHSTVGAVPSGGIVQRRPFRAPHHTTSYVGLVGGGTVGPRPGEVSLAHRGVLFLDELPEFSIRALEALREPLETRRISVARAWGSVDLPADFQLVAAMNPCPCGFLGDGRRWCRCTERSRQRYANRISGPLLDRIDIQVTVRAIDPALIAKRDGATTGSAEAAALVARARARQHARWSGGGGAAPSGGPILNARVPARLLEASPFEAEATSFLEQAARELLLSARGITKTKRVARTIADLAGRDSVTQDDVAEALQLRRVDAAHPRDASALAGELVGGSA